MSEITVMISLPMQGKTWEQIDEEKANMMDLVWKIYPNACIRDSIIENPEEKTELECFSESIFHMSQSDILAMGYGWKNARECKLEHEIAKAYNMPILYLDDIEGDSK